MLNLDGNFCFLLSQAIGQCFVMEGCFCAETQALGFADHISQLAVCFQRLWCCSRRTPFSVWTQQCSTSAASAWEQEHYLGAITEVPSEVLLVWRHSSVSLTLFRTPADSAVFLFAWLAVLTTVSSKQKMLFFKELNWIVGKKVYPLGYEDLNKNNTSFLRTVHIHL